MGAISGLDRIRFRGTLRWLASERGILTKQNLLKDFPSMAYGCEEGRKFGYRGAVFDEQVLIRRSWLARSRIRGLHLC
ncbi:MAG: hypothetical protein M5U24_14750 [Candidatus Kuenenia sp.]|uniref:hypothetical protein n=1 Tax=Candidatus Kuenenia sp. TaxID=2499824 RepID=UPI0022BF0F06|nr:hypothetical protein [Candidatus Kuenenia sp.]MCZ7623707.1 hypothetical protein [Candidatus Kuenenia sp.]